MSRELREADRRDERRFDEDAFVRSSTATLAEMEAREADAVQADRVRRLNVRIHIRAKQLFLEDTVYRALLVRLTGQSSCTAIDGAGLRTVVDALHCAVPWLVGENGALAYCKAHSLVLLDLAGQPTCPTCGIATNESATLAKPGAA